MNIHDTEIYRYICLILLEKQFDEVYLTPMNSFGCASNITCNPSGKITEINLWFSVRPTEYIVIILPFYYVTCVHISNMVLTES